MNGAAMNGPSNYSADNGAIEYAEDRDVFGASGQAFAAFDVADIADDALERAADMADGRAITVGYCTHWYTCGWPL